MVDTMCVYIDGHALHPKLDESHVAQDPAARELVEIMAAAKRLRLEEGLVSP